jgi:nucleotide-binding universal stress UspA family protein
MPDRVAESVDFDGGAVVGVDGSESSVQALLSAAGEAACHGWTLHVLRAWSVRTVPRPPQCPPGAVPTLGEYEREALRRTAEIVRATLGERPPCRVELHMVHAPPSQALIEASERADLLVVGHRGRSGLAGLLLGPVAEQCVRRAHCPVLVVRPREQDPDARNET